MFIDEETEEITDQGSIRPVVGLHQDYGWVIFEHTDEQN